MSVSLAKGSDNNTWYPNQTDMDNEAWNSTVLLPMYLSTIYPRGIAKVFYDDLKTNHLPGLAELFEYERRYDNSTGRLADRSVS